MPRRITAASILITLVGLPLYYLWMAWQRRRGAGTA